MRVLATFLVLGFIGLGTQTSCGPTKGTTQIEPCDDPANDGDFDGLCNDVEEDIGTDPNNPDTDGDGLNDFDEVNMGTDPLNPDTDGDGVSDGDEITLGTDPLTPDQPCAQESAEATETDAGPVDIIFIIDNSGSMTAEIEAVQNNINQNFAQIIAASNLDYRIIMFSEHGAFDPAESICISQPLSGHSCNPVPAQPTNTSRFFHYDYPVESSDSLTKFLARMDTPDNNGNPTGGVREWLREDAFKVFIEFTDDQSSMTAANFDQQLLASAPEHFGTAQNRRYQFHSIVGIEAKANPTEAWLPNEAVQNTKCVVPNETQGAVNAGTRYQDLSILTGGLRFPLCEFGKYDVIFNKVAEGVIDVVTLPCAYDLPVPAGSKPADPNKVVVVYEDKDGNRQTLTRVDTEDQCGPGSWYLNPDDKIVLCKAQCDAVTGEEGKLDVLTGCLTDIE